MSRLFTIAPFLLGLAILSSSAAAGCREDPRKMGSGDEAARLKAYNCSAGGASAANGIKVEFYSFSNESAAMVISGRPIPSMAKIVGKPEVVKNDVFSKLKYIVETFGSTETYVEGAGDANIKISAAVNGGQPFESIDEGKITLISVKDEVAEYPAAEIVELNQQRIPDNINVYYACKNSNFSDSTECPKPEDRNAVFWRYAKIDDIADFHRNVTLLSEAARANKGVALWSEVGSEINYDKSFKLLSYLAGEAGLPRTFMILVGIYASNSCQNYWDFSITTPKITLEAAIIRNDTDHQIRVDSILGAEIVDGPLRAASDATPADVRRMSLNMPIQPGNSLLVPTSITLKPNPSYQLGHEASLGAAATYQRLRAKGITARANVFAVPEFHDFVFGPELKVAGLIVDGNAIDFREKSLNDMDIAFSGGVGSCPYLLSWDSERRDWTEHGKFLHEANDASREQTQAITLPGFVSRFRVEEREPEVATIDDAEIAFSLKNGSSITLKPDMAPPAKAGRQLLFWGDARELEFTLPSGIAPADVVQSRLSLTGYYERYSSLPNSAYRGGGAFFSDPSFSTVVNPLHAFGVGPICRTSAPTALHVSTAISSPSNFARRQ
jgi:hypothetical protein